jgi:hypothetical protein
MGCRVGTPAGGWKPGDIALRWAKTGRGEDPSFGFGYCGSANATYTAAVPPVFDFPPDAQITTN